MLELRDLSTHSQRSRTFSLLPALLIYGASLAITSPVYFGDSLYYANDVLRSLGSQGAIQGLWEFGHLLWRPLGALIAPLALAWTPDSWAWTPLLKITFGLVLVSEICGAILILLLYDLIRTFVAQPWLRLLLIVAFVWSNPVLGYSQTASSYIPSLMFLAAAIWIQAKLESNPRNICLSAVVLSAAVLSWFPTILALPSIASLRTFLRADGFPRRRSEWIAPLQIAGLSVSIVAVVLVTGGWLAGERSGSDYISWIGGSRHDLSQNRQWLRAIGGVAHLLFEPSTSGVHLKRFLLRDPYNPVNILELIPVTLSRIGAAYVLYASVVGLGMLSKRARPLLMALLLAAVPMLFFALVLFEPSASERFLPVLPLLFLTLSAGWYAPGRLAAMLRAAAILALISIPITNFSSFATSASTDFRDAEARLVEFRRQANPQDLLVTVTFDDPLVRLIEQHPFHSANRPAPVPTYQVVAIASSDALQWKENLASRVRAEWRQNHEVWISKSLLAERPAAYVNWVEADSPAARWRAYSAFFQSLSYDRETGRPDGFARIARVSGNLFGVP